MHPRIFHANIERKLQPIIDIEIVSVSFYCISVRVEIDIQHKRKQPREGSAEHPDSARFLPSKIEVSISTATAKMGKLKLQHNTITGDRGTYE